jgi:hypothetical protein
VSVYTGLKKQKVIKVMRIVRGTKVKWKEGSLYLKGRVRKIYEKATASISDKIEKDFLIRQENGAFVIKNGSELEKVSN